MDRNSRARSWAVGGPTCRIDKRDEDPPQWLLLGLLEFLEELVDRLLGLAGLVGEEGDDFLLAGLGVDLGQTSVRVQKPCS